MLTPVGEVGEQSQSLPPLYTEETPSHVVAEHEPKTINIISRTTSKQEIMKSLFAQLNIPVKLNLETHL